MTQPKASINKQYYLKRQFSKINSHKNLQIASIMIVSVGILFRFYHQFINWAYNEDEVSLGLDILNHDFLELLKPFDSFQSSPPLLLLLQKLFSLIGPSYISLKILSFLSSSVALIYFKKIIEKRKITLITIGLLLIFAFNPFILYHSLTLKQYTIDLTFGLLAVYYFEKKRSFIVTYWFFTIGCLMSNAALFFTAAFIINIFLEDFPFKSEASIKENIQRKLKEALPLILAPFLYIGYFVWFIGQPGADEAKDYMVNYWHFWFVPLNEEVFWWFGVQVYRMMFFFYSTYLFLGIIMLTGFLFGCYSIFKKQVKVNHFFVKIYIVVIGIHLILSTIQIYPFSDRLYLYMAPLVLYMAIYGLVFLLDFLNLKKVYIGTSILLFAFLLLIFNMSYINTKENDIMALNENLKSYSNQKIFRTSRAELFINKWVAFTNYPNLSKGLINSRSRTRLDSIKKSDLVISRRYKNFGHKLRPVKIEDSLKLLLAARKSRKVISVDGYDVYLIME